LHLPAQALRVFVVVRVGPRGYGNHFFVQCAIPVGPTGEYCSKISRTRGLCDPEQLHAAAKVLVAPPPARALG
jgi:hypothetical protein